MKAVIRTFVVLVALFVTQRALATPCGTVGTFPSGSCCQGLVKDADNRCQLPSCKKVGEAGTAQANGMSSCCFGLVLVAGVCREPTLLQTKCSLMGGTPTLAKPCCAGLKKSTTTSKCVASGASCSGAQLSSCCYGSTTNSCSCYCPAPYYND